MTAVEFLLGTWSIQGTLYTSDIEQSKEMEYFSEKIAEMIYRVPNSTELLTLAEEKAKYYRVSKVKQGI